MANIKQQKKRIHTDAQKRLVNRSFKSQVKTAIINAEKGIKANVKNVSELVINAQRLLDKTLTKKIKKLNYVSRKKSQLQKQLKVKEVTKKN
ncbi:MAG: 30S ribosomal protein S20 [Mollicutes bacterium]|nr:MAG: 30S ribosomal protein S20 [Mollicutes bacterium]